MVTTTRMGRPPGGGSPRIDWKSPDERRAYKREGARDAAGRRLADQREARKKACNGPLCKGAIKSFDEFYPNPEKSNGIESRCKECKNHARTRIYERRREYEIQRVKCAYRKARALAIKIYGGQCDLCGSSHDLEFDHIDWDGSEHRKVENQQQMVKRIADSGERITDYRLRLLCGPCHRAHTQTMSRNRLTLLCATSNNWPACL